MFGGVVADHVMFRGVVTDHVMFGGVVIDHVACSDGGQGHVYPS